MPQAFQDKTSSDIGSADSCVKRRRCMAGMKVAMQGHPNQTRPEATFRGRVLSYQTCMTLGFLCIYGTITMENVKLLEARANKSEGP